jgi:hypothetical protein
LDCLDDVRLGCPGFHDAGGEMLKQ